MIGNAGLVIAEPKSDSLKSSCGYTFALPRERRYRRGNCSVSKPWRSAFLKIVMFHITGYSDQDLMERAQLAEPLGFFVKPVELKQLKLTIDSAIHKRPARGGLCQ